MEGQPEPIVMSIWWIYGAIAVYALSFIGMQIANVFHVRENIKKGRGIDPEGNVVALFVVSWVPAFNTLCLAIGGLILFAPLVASGVLWVYEKAATIDLKWYVDYRLRSHRDSQKDFSGRERKGCSS